MMRLRMSGVCCFWIILMPVAGLLAVLSSVPLLQPVGFVAILIPVFIGISRLRLAGLVVAFLVAENLVHFLKRFIFLLGPQPQSVYFGVQLLPAVILGISLFVAIRRQLGRPIPASARLMSAFLLVTVGATALSLSYVPYLRVLAAVHQQLLPVLMFFVGLSITIDDCAVVGRTLALLAAISVFYGVLQMITGPTVIDRLWSDGTYSYSVQASKVFNYLQGTNPQFRAYSYYADPLTWGFFLVAGLVGAGVAMKLAKISKPRWVLTLVVVPVGLFATLTRTCWVSFICTLTFYKALRYRVTQNPWLVFASVIGAFPATIILANFLYAELFLARRLPIVESPLVARYITVGTLEARISAWESLRDAVSRKPQGYGVMPYVRNRSEAPEWDRPLFSHNFIVELVFNSGVAGTILFLLFYFQWLREAFSAVRLTPDRSRQQALAWIISFSVGSMISGYFNGLNFATYEYFLMMGTLSKYALSVTSSIRRPARATERLVSCLNLSPAPARTGA